MAETQVPSVVAMLVCDQIIAEQGTNKKSLIGIFEHLGSTSFPVQVGRISVYAKLVDALGKHHFRLRLVTLKDEKLIMEIGIDADVKEGGGVELALNMGNLTLPEPGKYEFQLYAEDIYLHRVTMDAALVQGGQGWLQQPPR
jgi:hypothetical protein